MIDSVLRNELEPQFADLEHLRKNVIVAIFVCGVLFLVVIALLFLSPIGAAILQNGEAVITVFSLVIGLCGWIVMRQKKKFSSEFKEKVMKRVAAHFFPELKYQPENYIDKSYYDESEMFRKELTVYSGNDFFSGKLGEVDFQFSELFCQYTSGSGKNRQTHTAFRGFFLVGDFHRDIYFRTTIRPDHAEKWLGVLGRGLQRVGHGKRLVDLENPEFEEMFVVTGDDQVEARFILTPTFMEKLCDFRRRVGNDIHLCFVNGRMILGIETHHDYFEPNIFGEILSRKDLMKFIDMLTLLIGVAEEFLHHPKFTVNPPAMSHRPLPIPPPLTAAQKLRLKKS